MNITFKQIQAFLAVAELGSFTRAADRLGMAQPAVSQLVRELEGQLGLKLFDRTTRRTEVADGAREFEKAIRDAVGHIETVLRSASDVTTLKEGRLSIAAPPTFSAVVMPPAIAEFRQAYPMVQIVLVDTSQAIEELVAKGVVDLGFGTFSSEEPEVDRTVLMKDKMTVVVRRESELARRVHISWADLRGLHLIGLTVESGIRRLVDLHLTQLGIDSEYQFTVQSINTALSFVDHGLGIAILPSYAMALKNNRDIVAIELISPTVRRDISLIKRRGRSLTPAAERFSHMLRKWTRQAVPKDAPPSLQQ